jgi:AcrR family transcriptional regulator
MTKTDIIKAAFKVWGRDLYRTTSLAEIALELGVSKPALYRHFKDKDALLDAMHTAFFDDCTLFLKKGCEQAEAAPSTQEAYLVFIKTIAEYYIRNRDAFIFSHILVYNCHERKNTVEELKSRGIDFKHLVFENKTGTYPAKMQLLLVTVVFCIANFHYENFKTDRIPNEETIKAALGRIEDLITKGLKMDAQTISALDYERLEKQAEGLVGENNDDNALLKAVAEAVAEVGPWDATMEMVARRSGLSKSGLYAHFKNKQDMLAQFFITEFSKIVNFAKAQIETTEVPEEQLYLAIISIVYYLRSRPEIFVAMDWVKTRQLDLGKAMPGRLYRIIRSIKTEAIRKYDQHFLFWAAKWVIFMIVNTLALWPSRFKKLSELSSADDKAWTKSASEVPNECFRLLFRFISLGLEGLI